MAKRCCEMSLSAHGYGDDDEEYIVLSTTTCAPSKKQKALPINYESDGKRPNPTNYPSLVQ